MHSVTFKTRVLCSSTCCEIQRECVKVCSNRLCFALICCSGQTCHVSFHGHQNSTHNALACTAWQRHDFQGHALGAHEHGPIATEREQPVLAQTPQTRPSAFQRVRAFHVGFTRQSRLTVNNSTTKHHSSLNC